MPSNSVPRTEPRFVGRPIGPPHNADAMSGHFEIDFIGHACLKITAGKLRILTAPWLHGPAYTRQWYQYPLPDRSAPIDDVHYIHYSHGHEDHLHEPTEAVRNLVPE